MCAVKLKEYFYADLAVLLGEKISDEYSSFNTGHYEKQIRVRGKDLELSGRVDLHAQLLRELLPENYSQALKILISVLGPENEEETGMFTKGYWLMPVAKFIEKFGTDHFDESVGAIGELTKRHTGEYCIRPFIVKHPKKTVAVMKKWSKDKNFHLRRLSSEGLRPKLPWAPKLDLFIDEPEPVFRILENLKRDRVKFVMKSVANNINDYIKLNKDAAMELLSRWEKEDNESTRWIIRHATRNLRKKS